VPQLIEHGRVHWAGLGVQVMPDHIAAQWGVVGVIVRDVVPDSPAARAGIHSMRLDGIGNPREIDVITQINGEPVVRVVDLVDLLDDFEPGDSVRVGFERGGESFEVDVELEAL
jgi:S1-C subfamily serine protease